MMRNKIIIIGILVVGLVLISGCTEQTEEKPPLISSFKQINLYENGKIKSLNEIEGTADVLLSTLQKLNLQAKCVFSEERTQEIKRNDKVMEAIFMAPRDITISQWIEPEDRNHIKTDENGYRILEDVKTALFILEDNLNENLEGHVLVGHEVEGKIGYGCWAIQKEGSNELDKTWINEVNKAIGGAP